MVRRLTLFWLLLFSLAWAAPQEKDHADHEELRALLKGVVQAMNTRSYPDLKPYFHPSLRVTVVNQDKLSSPEEFDPYFKDWIGEGKYVKDMQMVLEADDLTELYGSGESRFGVVRGSGKEDYNLTDGRRLELKTRWTATVVKHQGKWKIIALHIGANFYNNPIVEQFQKAIVKWGLIGLCVGTLGGGLLVYLMMRRRRN